MMHAGDHAAGEEAVVDDAGHDGEAGAELHRVLDLAGVVGDHPVVGAAGRVVAQLDRADPEVEPAQGGGQPEGRAAPAGSGR